SPQAKAQSYSHKHHGIESNATIELEVLLKLYSQAYTSDKRITTNWLTVILKIIVSCRQLAFITDV
ncbi:6674_t:CDS:1, partial [Gigaspora margarita]